MLKYLLQTPPPLRCTVQKCDSLSGLFRLYPRADHHTTPPHYFRPCRRAGYATFPVIATMPERAVVKHVAGEERFTFSFLFTSQTGAAARQFNMNRELAESPVQFSERIAANVGKVVNKKNKNKKGKGGPGAKGKGGEAEKGKVGVAEKGKAEVGADGGARDDGDSVAVTFLKNNQPLDLASVATAGELLFMPDLRLRVQEQEFGVVVNPPLVEEVKLTPLLMAGYLLYPSKLKIQFGDESLTQFTWFVSEGKQSDTSPGGGGENKKLKTNNSLSWTERSRGFFFTPAQADIGRQVRLDVTAVAAAAAAEEEEGGQVVGDTTTVVSKGEVEAGPGSCPTQARHLWTSQRAGSEIPAGNSGDAAPFRVMSYNILADLYADSDFSRSNLFPQCPPYALSIDYRVKLILWEILGFRPDILCLQENDRKVFEYDLLPVLKRNGFAGNFNKKGGQVDEGLSCFYRTDRFTCIETRASILSEELQTNPIHQRIWNRIKSNEALVERMMGRTTAVFFSVLRSIQDPSKLLIVGNTHLYFKPDADHIRLLQYEMCLTEFRELVTSLSARHPGSSCSLVFCGDFNSTPPFAVLEYALGGSIPASHPDWRSCGGEEVEGLTLEHGFSLDTAAGTPQFTNYTIGFKDCLDYIFYDKTQLGVEQVIPFPTEEELSQHVALPNVAFPSDHVSLVVDLKWL